MCEPTTIMMAASLAIAAASSVSTIESQRQQANAQNKANDRQYESDMEAYRNNLAQTDLQGQQATKQASQKMFENSLAARQAQSTATVNAGENGVGGLSVDALLGDIDTRQANYDNSVMSNLRDTQASLDSQKQNIRTNTNSQINSLVSPTAPNYLGEALKIGSAGLNAYGKYKMSKG